MKGDKKTMGVDANAATGGSGKGVSGCDPYARTRPVDEKAAPFGGGSGGRMSKGGRAKRSRSY